MSLAVILSIILIHWVADFVFQAEVWAENKSKELKPLLKHTYTYSAIWLIVGSLAKATGAIHLEPGVLSLFVLITFVLHTATDYFTSKIVSKRFANKHYGSPIPNFGAFTVIGFDQVLHYTQLFLTYYLLTK